jgi:DNA polymerase-3 subunit delta
MDILTAERARDAQAQSDALAAYLPRLPETVCLAFRLPTDTDKRRAAVKALYANACAVQCVTPSDADIERFIRREVKSRGSSIDGQTASFLINWSGRDLTRLLSEAEKLSALRKGEAITEDDVRELAIRTEESTVFQWLDALMDGRDAISLTILESLVDSGESVFPLLALAERRLKQLLYIARMSSENRPTAEISRVLGMPDFVVRREAQNPRPSKTIRAGLDLLMNTNEAIRSGRLSENAALPRIQFGLREVMRR